MAFNDIKEYSIDDIQSLIDNGVEESVHLEFKQAGALAKSNSVIKEIAKDVSAFANSDGGVIIYGVEESDHKASALSYVDGNDFTKEWLENVISSNIQKKIDGLEVIPLRVDGDIEKSIYVVKIPRSYNAPHMVSKDKEVSIETINVVKTPKEYDIDYQEPNDVFRLEKLYIDNFKNIKQQTFNFTSHDGLTLLIGSNSSGKSNLIEAICGVFYSLYERYEWRKQRCKAIPNKFEIEYTSRSFKNRINVDATRYQAFNNVLSNNNPITTPDLPSRIVAIYSGEEDRLKQHYFDPFLRKYRQGSQLKMPSMFFLNKDHWDIALLCLLYSDRKNETSFVSELLDGIVVSDVRINFIASNIVSLERYNNLLIYQLNIHCNEQGLISIEDIATIIDYDVRELFQSLYIAKTQTKATIRSIDFNFAQEDDNQPSLNYRDTRSVAIHKYCLQSLSEGQKKQILITAALEFAGQENSLFLLDEPDAHVHLSNKLKIIDVVKKYTHNRHIIITTHSPTLCKGVSSESIVMMSNGMPNNVENQYEAAMNLVGERSAVDLLFLTKHILIVEGKTDCQYIGKALELYKDEYPDLFNAIDFVAIGGTDGDVAKDFIGKILDTSDRRVILLVDRDGAGLKCARKVLCNDNLTKVDVDIKNIPNATNKFLVMIPHIPHGDNSDFVIEDYFGLDKIKELAINKIENDTKSFLGFPKIKDEIKKEILPNFCRTTATKADMNNFKVLLNKLRETINQ